jgi:hypothetical protein
VKQFIQNVHHFRDEGLRDPKPPTEHVAVFDEAQRAWDREALAGWMKRKKGHADWNVAEAEFLISTLDRHDDWATIICLVGGGQEINRGEAGIDSWLEAMRTTFPDWQMHISSKLTEASLRRDVHSTPWVRDQRRTLMTVFICRCRCARSAPRTSLHS